MTGSGLGHASQLYLPVEVTWSFKSTPMPTSAADILMSLVGATWASGTRVARICRSLFSMAPRESGLCGGRTQTACPASRLGPRWPPPASLPPTSDGLVPGAAAWTRPPASDRSSLWERLPHSARSKACPCRHAWQRPLLLPKSSRISITASSPSQCPRLHSPATLQEGTAKSESNPAFRGAS